MLFYIGPLQSPVVEPQLPQLEVASLLSSVVPPVCLTVAEPLPLSGSSSTTTTLSGSTSILGRALACGHLPSVADAVMDHSALCDMVFERIVRKINLECFRICQLTKPLSPFRKIDASKCSSFQWKMFVEELSHKVPTFLKILSSIVTSNDKRKQAAVIGSHNPGLSMAAAILA